MKLTEINPGNSLTCKELYSELWKAESGVAIVVKVGNQNLKVIGWEWKDKHLILQTSK